MTNSLSKSSVRRRSLYRRDLRKVKNQRGGEQPKLFAPELSCPRLTPQKKGRKRPFFRGGEGEDHSSIFPRTLGKKLGQDFSARLNSLKIKAPLRAEKLAEFSPYALHRKKRDASVPFFVAEKARIIQVFSLARSGKNLGKIFLRDRFPSKPKPPPRRKTCRVLSLRLTPQKKGLKRPFFRGGEGEDRTRAPVTRPNSLANCPLDPLGTSPYSFFADNGGYFYIIPPVPPFVNTFL